MTLQHGACFVLEKIKLTNSSSMSDELLEFELDRRRWGVLVNGLPVDPSVIAVSKRFGELQSRDVFQLAMGKLTLGHELEEADQQFESVLSFVQNDIKRFQGDAASGYLSMIQDSSNNGKRHTWWKRFRKQPKPLIEWEWCGVDSVEEDDKTIIIKGRVAPVS